MSVRRARGTLLAVALASALVLTGCTATPSAPDTTAPAPAQGIASAADVVSRLAPSVVTVRAGRSVGSGVVFRPDVVVTNQHVVAGTREVTLDYADGRSSAGTVLATDPVTDLAVIRTARTGLPVPEYRTESPRPGDPVLAIGSPLGFEGTVTSGIVSGLNRQIPGSASQGRALVDLLQVDAAISPGNSGGALLDWSGRVIGINEAYIPPSAGAVSIGFAIPASTAVDIAGQLLADGTATHPYLGLRLARLTPEIRRGLGVAAESGALVAEVVPGGPAAAAGVRRGDVVVAFGDRPVGSVEDLIGALREAAPQQATSIGVVREGNRVDLPVTVGTEPGSR